MNIRKFCKICRFPLNFPEYNENINYHKPQFIDGMCSQNHYTLKLFYDHETNLYNEKLCKLKYDEFELVLDYADNKTYLYVNDSIVAESNGIINCDFKNKKYMICKLETMMIFS